MNRVLSGSPYEALVGMSRAVRKGSHISVSGTASLNKDGETSFPYDVFNQTLTIIRIINDALQYFGSDLTDITRTRIYVKEGFDPNIAIKAHADAFKDICPACTVLMVSGFLRDDWVVELEADAVLNSASHE